MPLRIISKLFTPCVKYQFNNVSFLTVSMTSMTLYSTASLFILAYHDEQAYKSGDMSRRIKNYKKNYYF